MDEDHQMLASHMERLQHIDRTVREHSVHHEVDIKSIVERVMDAYSAEQIEKAESQNELESTTAALARRVANVKLNPLADVAADFFAVIVPAVAYLPLLYLFVDVMTEWDKPLAKPSIAFFVSIP